MPNIDNTSLGKIEDPSSLDVPIEKLRRLRQRVDQLRETVVADLTAFLHEKDHLSFRRKPDSSSQKGDVNVTTTCSCVMALVLTNEFDRFYDLDKEIDSNDRQARDILECLVSAPWMSSGLTSNNAFTTALVLRTYGFLIDQGVLSSRFTSKKSWDLELTLKNPIGLAKRLKQQRTETTRFLYRSLSDNTRNLFDQHPQPNEEKSHNTQVVKSLTTDLRHIIHNGWIYHRSRFPNTSQNTVSALRYIPKNYQRAELNHQLLHEAFPREVKRPKQLSFTQIARLMAANADNFSINDYPPAAPVAYWFVDGVSRSGIKLTPTLWKRLFDFANKEFNHQRSLVLANHDAMMDPVTMGMAACLCARLLSTCSTPETGISTEDLATLPSLPELEHSILEMFSKQTSSGIWPKYFPMFHYQEAGSNFCFTFELLEAILHEFGDEPTKLLRNSTVIEGLEKAVTWCEKNRLRFPHRGKTYEGWNSGGEIATLQKNKPESWATAVVHMFLWELSNALSHRIQQRLLDEYGANPERSEPDEGGLNGLLDVELSMQGPKQTLITLLKKKLVPPNKGRTESDLRRNGVRKPMSALLFGPPGTSKTSLAKAIAQALGWPRIVINPSDFVKESLEKVYLRADEIFRDLGDLSAVVVFFDEMDALMQSREDVGLDTATQFLTTSMLPQLTKLHDKGRVVFLMATNYQSKFDPALKRAGRFDFLLCVGPPTLKEKIRRLDIFFPRGELESAQAKMAKAILRRHAKRGTWLFSQLELFTFDEFREFLKHIGNGTNIGTRLQRRGQTELEQEVRNFSEYVTLRLNSVQLPKTKRFTLDDLQVLAADAKPKSEIEKYLRDRRESKSQYES